MFADSTSTVSVWEFLLHPSVLVFIAVSLLPAAVFVAVCCVCGDEPSYVCQRCRSGEKKILWAETCFAVALLAGTAMCIFLPDAFWGGSVIGATLLTGLVGMFYRWHVLDRNAEKLTDRCSEAADCPELDHRLRFRRPRTIA